QTSCLLSVPVLAFSDSDYGGASLDRKSTTCGCQFLVRRLISWQCKKQTIVVTSTTEAEYVAAANCCGQANLMLSGKFGVVRKKFVLLVTVTTIETSGLRAREDRGLSDSGRFQRIVYFLASSSIHHALIAVVVTEASIRSSLNFNDVDGIACLTNEAIFQNLAFSKSTSWNEFSTNIASAVICLATNQKFNFSKLIFDGMLRNLDNTKKKFLMYPRFLMVFLNNQIKLGEPFNDVYPTPAHNLKVFSNMSRKGVKFSGKVTPLFDSMLVPHQVPKGEGSEQPIEPQATPSPTQPNT
ncbi:hypothetical protein Tco_0806606, partial [Tanacetum coccineum]